MNIFFLRVKEIQIGSACIKFDALMWFYQNIIWSVYILCIRYLYGKSLVCVCWIARFFFHRPTHFYSFAIYIQCGWFSLAFTLSCESSHAHLYDSNIYYTSKQQFFVLSWKLPRHHSMGLFFFFTYKS